MGPSGGDLTPRDAATAAGLRERYGFLREVVADMERSVPYAAALVRSRRGLRLDLRDAEQSAARSDPQEGIVLTASNGYRLEEVSSDMTDAVSVRRLAAELVERATAYRPTDGELALEIEAAGDDGDHATPMQVDPAGLGLADKLSRFDERRRHLRDIDGRAVQAICTYAEVEGEHVFVNRAGMSTQQIRRLNVSLIVFVSDGSRQEYGILINSGSGGLECVAVSDEELARTSETAGRLLGATTLEPGRYEVVSDPPTTGVIAHEAFGHGVETDMFLKERARAAEYIGRRVGSDLVNILDDPTVPGAYGSYFVDDEGMPASATEIIRNGILQRGITDLYSASRLGLARSANGRRESVQRKAYARMSNTFFAPGQSRREELLASLDDGLLLRETLNGMEDPKGWGIQIWAHYALEYRGGQPTGRIFSPVAITGFVPDLLADISMVSDDFELVAGSCGKGWKEIVPVSSGGPYLRTRCRLA
jgi:TldD protein